jgi:flagellar protein FlbD
MIRLQGLDHKVFILNDDHIERIQEVPETLITLSNGKKYLVMESAEEVVNKVIDFKKKIHIETED